MPSAAPSTPRTSSSARPELSLAQTAKETLPPLSAHSARPTVPSFPAHSRPIRPVSSPPKTPRHTLTPTSLTHLSHLSPDHLPYGSQRSELSPCSHASSGSPLLLQLLQRSNVRLLDGCTLLVDVGEGVVELLSGRDTGLEEGVRGARGGVILCERTASEERPGTIGRERRSVGSGPQERARRDGREEQKQREGRRSGELR